MRIIKILLRFGVFNLVLFFILIISSGGLLVLRNTQHLFFRGAEISEPVGIVLQSAGSSRRPYDSLNWIDINSKTVVRNGDFLRTDDKELIFQTSKPQGEIKIAPHSLVRVSTSRGRIQIELREGNAHASPEFLEPTPFPTPSPLQKTPVKDIVIKGVQLYPKKDSIILFKNGASLTVSLPFECKTPCKVKLTFKGRSIKEHSLQGFPLQLSLNLSAESQGRYDWTVESETVHEFGGFEAFLYSKEFLQDSLLQDKDIDVLR